MATEQCEPHLEMQRLKSTYGIELDSRSIGFIEQLQEARPVHVLVMNSQQFRDQFIDLITEQCQSDIPFEDGASCDKAGHHYSRLLITTEEFPRIIYTEGAYPCSIVIAFDDNGNAAIAHVTQFNILSEEEHERQQQRKEGKLAGEDLSQFALINFTADSGLIISATNLDTAMRSEIAATIAAGVRGFEPAQTGCVFTDSGNYLDSRKDVPIGKLRTSDDTINGAYFIPKQLSKDGKNVIILVGDRKEDEENSLENFKLRQALRRR